MAESEKEKYAKYLCSPEWWAKRKAVLQRCKGTCETAGCDNVAGHVHHLTYIRKYHEELSDLKALCVPCHEAIHNGIDPERQEEYAPSKETLPTPLETEILALLQVHKLEVEQEILVRVEKWMKNEDVADFVFRCEQSKCQRTDPQERLIAVRNQLLAATERESRRNNILRVTSGLASEEESLSLLEEIIHRERQRVSQYAFANQRHEVSKIPF